MSNLLKSTNTENYEVSSTIGRGAYATVYKGRDKNVKGRYVAMKEVILPVNNEEGLPSSSLREIGLLKQIEKTGHPNIVKLLDVFFGNRTLQRVKLVLVFEHFNQDLSQFISRSPESGLDCGTIKSLMHQILSGIDFLHSHRVLHRDLKPQNILVSDDGVVRIADFGLAKIYSCDMTLTSLVVTLYYRSPEVLLTQSYGSSVDIWSCGCILAELFTKRPLFSGCSEQDQMSKIFECLGPPMESDFPGARIPLGKYKQVATQSIEKCVPQAGSNALNLIKSMLIYNQDRRITARKALEHIFFEDVKPPNLMKTNSSSMSSSSSESSSSSSSTTINSSSNSSCFSPPHKRSNLMSSFDKPALTDNNNLYNSTNPTKSVSLNHYSNAHITISNNVAHNNNNNNNLVNGNHNVNDDSKIIALGCSPAKKTR